MIGLDKFKEYFMAIKINMFSSAGPPVTSYLKNRTPLSGQQRI